VIYHNQKRYTRDIIFSTFSILIFLYLFFTNDHRVFLFWLVLKGIHMIVFHFSNNTIKNLLNLPISRYIKCVIKCHSLGGVGGVAVILILDVAPVGGSILCSGTSCKLSCLLVLSLSLRIFLRNLRSTSLHKNRHF
jgi:hypothetical protein